MVTLAPSAPAPIVMGPPATLLTMITALAPAFSAESILVPNSHKPLLITTILPAKSVELVISSHASCTSGAESYKRASSPTRGASSGKDAPKPAG